MQGRARRLPRTLASRPARCYSPPSPAPGGPFRPMPLLSVSAHDVDAAGLSLDAELPPAWLEAELGEATVSPKGPGRIAARLSRSGNDIVVRGRVKASLTIPCARCLEPAPLDVDTELSLLLQPAPAPSKPAAGKAKPAKEKKEEEYEFSSAEADVDTYDGETVVLDAFVREALLLEVPNFPLCSEGCPGIRPAAGSAPEKASANGGDPRLAPLGALKARLAAAEPQKKKKKE